jgi:ERCC4-type nuclease
MVSVSLILDNREKDLKSAFPDATYKNLDLGDIQININKEDGSSELFLLIERKTMKDLISSVNDGRYREQKKRLLESIPREKIMYLLEGHLDDIPGQMKTLFGMIINSIFRDKLHILRFECIEETIYFIKRVIKKLNDNDENIMVHLKNNSSSATASASENSESVTNSNNSNTNTNSDLEYLSTIKLKKKDNLTSNNCSLLQLAQIPGMSLQNAKIIIDKYQSIANLIKTYYEIDENNRAKMLIDLEISISNGKKRKLGKVLSERIYQYLFNISVS